MATRPDIQAPSVPSGRSKRALSAMLPELRDLTPLTVLTVLTVLLIGLGGCVRVPAWKRGTHADRRMNWSRCDERAGARQHTFAVREGAAGGGGGSGGACGCD